MTKTHTKNILFVCMQERILDVMSWWVLDYEILKLTSIWCKLTSHHWSLIDRLLLLFLLKLFDVKFNPLWWSITFWVALSLSLSFPMCSCCSSNFSLNSRPSQTQNWNFTKEKIAILYDHKVVSSSDKIFHDKKRKFEFFRLTDWTERLKYRLHIFFL